MLAFRILLVIGLGFTGVGVGLGQNGDGSVQLRAAALSSLFREMWEDRLKRSPEFASSLGDRRYNDQLTDLSPRAINDELARRRMFLTRLVSIDTSGLGEQERLSSELMQRS